MRIHLFGVKCQNTNLHAEKVLLYLLLMLILKIRDSYHSIGSRTANTPIVSNAAPAMIFTFSLEICTNNLKLIFLNKLSARESNSRLFSKLDFLLSPNSVHYSLSDIRPIEFKIFKKRDQQSQNK